VRRTREYPQRDARPPQPRRRTTADPPPRLGPAVPRQPTVPIEAVIDDIRHPLRTEAPRGGVAIALATAGGAGYAPIAPGTAGSAVGVGVYCLLADLGAALFGLTVLALAFLGIWASDRAEAHFGQKDDGRIVIDEVVGQLLTLAPLALVAAPGERRSWVWLLLGFLLFRALDIWKPPPVGWAERAFAGGAGVMMDDVFAGVLGCLVLGVAIAWVGP